MKTPLPDLRIYISFVEDDRPLAQPCAELLRRTIKAGLKNRYNAVFFCPANVPLGEFIHESLERRVDELDVAVVLVSYAYLLEENEAKRVHAKHQHPIIVRLEDILPSTSISPFDWSDIIDPPPFDAATDDAERRSIANHVASLVGRVLTERETASRRAEPRMKPDEIAKELSAHAQLQLTAEAVPARAKRGQVEATCKQEAETPIDSETQDDVTDVVSNLVCWAHDSSNKHSSVCMLLGDVGTGKTTTSILLARRLLELRKADEEVPLPLYFDLRDLSPTGMTDFGLRAVLTSLLATAVTSDITVDSFLNVVRNEHALIIFDSLDETLVHLSPGDRQRLTRALREVLTLSGTGTDNDTPRTRLLLTCRTQYFRTVEEELSFFDEQGHESKRSTDYLVLTLLPFDEDQIREYLRRNIPEADTDRLLETIRSVHNLRELASQPVLLNMIRQVLLTIDEDLSAGHRVRSVDLYERFADKWLRRDDGKHSLIPRHKIQLMMHLAWQIWRSGSRTWSARWMEEWMLQFLHTHPDMQLHYAGRMPDQWKQDFRTATFLARRGDDFSFAHSSLLEYFLARCFADSLEAESEDEALAAWDITRPSDETFAFFAELIDRLSPPTQRQRLARLTHVGTLASATARTNVFAYTLRALEKGAPHPRPDALNLANTDLRGWTIGSEQAPLNLAGVSLRSAQLNDAHIHHTRLDGIDATGASMRRTLFEHCTLSDANLEDADLAGTVFRHCDIEGSSLDKATRYRTQLLHTTGHHQQLSDVLTAPLMEDTPLRVLPEAQILGGYSVDVTAVAWSPDATHILTASSKVARVWDASTREHMLTFAHTTSVTAVAWSPDATRILTASNDHSARVWDAKTGEKTLTLNHKAPVNAVAWSPDATHILTASQDGTARIWDATTGENTLTLTHTKSVTAVAWSPDGRQILTGSQDGTARTWDATTGANTLTLAHKDWVTAAAWSPDGRQILTGSDDSTVRMWDARTGDSTLTLTHTGPVNAIAWSPNGTHILTASDGARMWDAVTGANTLTLTHTEWVWDVAWSPNGTHILTASDHTALIWDAVTGANTLTLAHTEWVWDAGWSPDATRILTTSNRTARVWDAATGTNTLTLTHTDGVWDAAWSPDGTRILTGSQDGTVHIWDAVTGANTLTLAHTAWVRVVAWSPDNAHILTGSEDGTARIWDATTGNNTLTLTHTDWVTAVAWSPDGQCILTGSQDGTARIWDATTGNNTLTLTHTDWVRAVAWSPDGTHILTGSQDGTARIWDATTGEQVRFFIAVLPEGECAVLTPDQTRVIGASADAWRWLGRYAVHPGGALERIPIEIDGPLPPLEHN